MMQRVFRSSLVAKRVLQCHPAARQRVAAYYVKPKQKASASGQAWLALGGVTAGIACMGVYFLGKPEDEIAGLSNEPDKYRDENVVKAYLLRSRDRYVEFRKSFADPSREKLLPDMMPPQYQRPYTLVLELNDILFHSEYDRNVGWKYQKRPGVDAFFASLFDLYEIVTFTSENAFAIEPVIRGLDPNQYVTYHLYRHDTKYIDGHYVKDLSNINRPLSKVIVIDTDSLSIKYQKENSILLDKWTGDINDRKLQDLILLLQAIAANGVDDVRTVLDYYKSRGEGNILDTFKEAQAALIQEERQLQQENMARQSSKQRGSGTPISTFSFSRLKRGGGGGGGGGRGGGGGGGWEQHTSPLQAPPEHSTVGSVSITSSTSPTPSPSPSPPPPPPPGPGPTVTAPGDSAAGKTAEDSAWSLYKWIGWK